jgi:hypothetical protein
VNYFSLSLQAISDIPAILFAKELLEAYPNAKVILSTRDIDSWHNSVMNSVQAQVTNYPQRFCQLFHLKMFHFNVFYEAWNLFFHGNFEDRERYVYEEYNAMIRGLVPKERSLEYHVSERWGPLCEWLGRRSLSVRCRIGFGGGVCGELYEDSGEVV